MRSTAYWAWPGAVTSAVVYSIEPAPDGSTRPRRAAYFQQPPRRTSLRGEVTVSPRVCSAVISLTSRIARRSAMACGSVLNWSANRRYCRPGS